MNQKSNTPAPGDAAAGQAGGDTGRKIASHSRAANGIFHLKALLLSVQRVLQDMRGGGARKHAKGNALCDAPVIASHEGNLWNADDNPLNWRLTAGKVHNLRTAAAKLDGVEIPAGEVFGFWAHVGRPARSRGFVVGRAVREGCITPSLAGGLCQLSNALYDAALNAGLEIVERHRHSGVIRGTLAERDRDATIKWNYLDLRFRAAHPLRIEVELTGKKLLIRLRGTGQQKPHAAWREVIRPASPLRDCYSCGQAACASHRVVEPVTRQPAAFLLDERWPEYDGYLAQTADANDVFLCPVDTRILRKRNYAWNLAGFGRVRTFTLHTLLRALAVRRTAGKGGKALQSTLIAHDRKLAQRYMRQIPPECTHLVVAQNLLPHLWEAGALGGRTFDVLMYRLPLGTLQERLDGAYSRNPRSTTLNDFRAPDAFVDLESRALERARRIITPHAEIASMFGERALPLKWELPATAARPAAHGTKILLAAPPLGRKGIYEVERLAEELELSVVALRGASEGVQHSRRIGTVDAVPYAEIGLVLLPAYVEHKPRIVLRAVAMGIPAVASEACGLQGVQGVTTVPAGDYEALKQAAIASLAAA